MTNAFADSCVEVIEHCLNTSADEHAWECEEEWWYCELGERPATYIGMTTMFSAEEQFILVVDSWLYWRRQVSPTDGSTP